MQIHIRIIRDSWSYGIISSWAPNDIKVINRAPMFGKPLPLNNDTSSSSKKFLCR
jgi:hypothetical protein